MITIIDYGSGNINAIENIYKNLKVPYKIAHTPEQAVDAEKLFLPGVGAFDETISKLDETGFRSVLDTQVLLNKVPILGICVGMQILAESSEEGELSGLGYIKGRVKKMDVTLLTDKPKLPHLGWNTISLTKSISLFENIDPDIGFYFLHNYYFDCTHSADMVASTNYGKLFASAVARENVFGVQFHPEKSHRNGIQLLHNFAKI
jgi:glutamine amidotransferase